MTGEGEEAVQLLAPNYLALCRGLALGLFSSSILFTDIEERGYCWQLRREVTPSDGRPRHAVAHYNNRHELLVQRGSDDTRGVSRAADVGRSAVTEPNGADSVARLAGVPV